MALQREVADRMISAGSPTTSALCLLLQGLSERFDIECGSMTTVHAFTSDQALQDYAGSDFRRSRSAAKNIIPNTHEASLWLGKILPEFEGRIMTWALNVPVQEGCLLDVTLVMKDAAITAEDVNEAMRAAASERHRVLSRWWRTPLCRRMSSAIRAPCCSIPRARSRRAAISSRH